MRIAKNGLFILFLAIQGLLVARPLAWQVPELIPFRQGDAWGYCDESGNLQIAAAYDGAMPFRDGSAVVFRAGKAGLIDTKGQMLLPAIYDAILNGALLRLRKDQHFALATRQGSLLTDFSADFIHPERSGLFLVEQGEHFGMVDTAGRQIVPAEFAHISILRDDQGNFTDLIRVHQAGKIGLYDRCGNLVASPQYDQVSTFEDGFSIVQRDGKFGLLDLEGHEVVPAAYDNLHPVRQGYAAAKVRNRWGFVDTEGREVIPFVYDLVDEAGFYQGRVAVQYQGAWMFIDRNGQPEISVNGPYQCLGALSEGMAAACVLSENGHPYYGYLNHKGRLVIPCQFSQAFPFAGGFAVVGKRVTVGNSLVPKFRYGVINRKGRLILPLLLASRAVAETCRDSIARIGWTSFVHTGRRCKVDEKGREFDCAFPAYQRIMHRFAQTRCENSSLIAIAEEGRWGFCDRNGKAVIPLKYAVVECFTNGLARVWPEIESEFHYYIDRAGREYFQAE